MNEYAYIDKKSAESTNGYVEDASAMLCDLAQEIGEKLKENGLLPQREKDGKISDAKLIVKVEPAYKYNKESKKKEPILNRNGETVYSSRIEINDSNEKLSLYAKNDISDGVKLVSMNATKFERNDDGSNKITHVKGNEISDEWKVNAIAQYIKKEGYIEEKQYSKLQNLAYDLNMKFKTTGSKVPNKDNVLVNDAYAQYKNDEYGERVLVKSHTEPNLLVELGNTSDDKPYAKAINFEYRDDDGKVASCFINTRDDALNMIGNRDVARAIADYKQPQKEQQAER